MFLFPICLFLFVKIFPNLIILSSKSLDFFFNNLDSFLFSFFPFFPFFRILFFFIKEFFLVTIEIFFQTIDVGILFVKFCLNLIVLFFQWLFFLLESFDLMVKLLFSLLGFFNFKLNVSDSFGIFHFSL